MGDFGRIVWKACSSETVIWRIKGKNCDETDFKMGVSATLLELSEETLKPGFHYTANATTTTQKQSDYKVEQSSFTLIALF